MPGSLPGFPQLSVDTLHDAFGYAQSGISALKPGFTAFPPEHPRLAVEYPANSSLT